MALCGEISFQGYMDLCQDKILNEWSEKDYYAEVYILNSFNRLM